MPLKHEVVDRNDAPKRTTNVAYADRQREYNEIVEPLQGNPDKAIRVDVDHTKGETQKGVSLALVYACRRLGFEGKSWYHGNDSVYIAQATEAEAKLRQSQKAARTQSQNSNGNGSKPQNEDVAATGDQTPRPSAQKPENAPAKK